MSRGPVLRTRFHILPGSSLVSMCASLPVRASKGRDVESLAQPLGRGGSRTMVSRMLGYVRDFFIADAFGAGLAADAFFITFRIPNLRGRLFAEGAFAQAFVPILGEYKNRRAFVDTKSLIDAVSTAARRPPCR